MQGGAHAPVGWQDGVAGGALHGAEGGVDAGGGGEVQTVVRGGGARNLECSF